MSVQGLVPLNFVKDITAEVWLALQNSIFRVSVFYLRSNSQINYLSNN